MSVELFPLLIHQMKLDPQTFSGQVIVVTGAGRGIGFHTARAFAHLGGKVILAELTNQGQDAERNIRSEGGDAHFFQTDVSDPESVSNLANNIEEKFGSAEVLINNAIFIQQSSAIEMPLAMWDRTIAVNLRGTFLMCRAFLSPMLKKDRGTILNLISTDAMPGLSAYIASKQAITGFTQTLALELHETGIRVVPFGPGMVDTPGIRSIADGLAPRLGLTKDQLLNLSLHAAYEGLMPPEHAAAAVVYLTAHLADEFHGQVVNGYEVLEKAGLLSSGSPERFLGELSQSTFNRSQQDLIQQLTEILSTTEAEFGQLPLFVRPMARQGFKRKAGASLPDWQQLLNDLNSDRLAIPSDMPSRLENLAKYYREVPEETARFTKDEATLQQVIETTQQRLQIIEEFQLTIKDN